MHKKLSESFNENYLDLNNKEEYKKNFLEFINSENISNKNEIIEWANKINSGTIQEFIQVYTEETPLCYSLNKYLRNCKIDEYDKIKYFEGPFSYALYKYANNDPKMKVNFSKVFYRKMIINQDDYELYKSHIVKIICYPSFTSTNEMDISKKNFSTSTAIHINNLKDDDIYVVLFINCKCNNSLIPTPFVNISYDSVNFEEKEFMFPPFSFFKIGKIENKTVG